MKIKIESVKSICLIGMLFRLLSDSELVISYKIHKHFPLGMHNSNFFSINHYLLAHIVEHQLCIYLYYSTPFTSRIYQNHTDYYGFQLAFV